MDHFKKSELICKCGCGLYNIDDNFLRKLNYAREKARIPFLVASGCRCEEHNAAEGGKETSDHITGQGADIVSYRSRTRWKIVSSALAAGIRRIGLHREFVHLGDNLNNPNPRIWLY